MRSTVSDSRLFVNFCFIRNDINCSSRFKWCNCDLLCLKPQKFCVIRINHNFKLNSDSFLPFFCQSTKQYFMRVCVCVCVSVCVCVCLCEYIADLNINFSLENIVLKRSKKFFCLHLTHNKKIHELYEILVCANSCSEHFI